MEIRNGFAENYLIWAAQIYLSLFINVIQRSPHVNGLWMS